MKYRFYVEHVSDENQVSKLVPLWETEDGSRLKQVEKFFKVQASKRPPGREGCPLVVVESADERFPKGHQFESMVDASVQLGYPYNAVMQRFCAAKKKKLQNVRMRGVVMCRASALK